MSDLNSRGPNSGGVQSARHAIDVHYNPVKHATDVHSGRLEYLRQVLTLSSAGLAGIAYFFADITKIPTEFWEKVVLGGTLVLLALALVFSLLGVSVYANLLRVIDREVDNPQVQAQPPPERRSSKFARSMVIHAQAALITLGLAGWGFAAFAAIRLIGGVSSQTPEAAMNEARELVSRQTNHNIGDVQLETFEIQGAEYKISYRIVPEDFIYAVTISKNDGEIKAAAHRTSK